MPLPEDSQSPLIPSDDTNDGFLQDLAEFIAASPSPHHVVESVKRRLEADAFRNVPESGPWPTEPGRYFVVRNGSIVAWDTSAGCEPSWGFRIVGAHSDSPNLRIRPHPDRSASGFRQLGVEVYGGALLNSWLDRDLGLSGRVAVDSSSGHPETFLVHIDEPIARIPQLAIHLNRSINADGLRLDPQQHIVPIWGTGTSEDGDLLRWIADRHGIDADSILAADLMLHDLTPPCLIGADKTLFAASRIDNQLSCHAGIQAFLGACRDGASSAVPVLAIFDHEEVGSESQSGASGSLLATVLERVALAAGLSRDEWFAALANSMCLSADGAHATHPNYSQRHEPDHQIKVNAGPVLKFNSNMRYGTDAVGAAEIKALARSLSIPLQSFVTRGDLPCGSTIGPVTAARLGVRTVDIGVAQLSMHSAREMCGAIDPPIFSRLLEGFFRTSPSGKVA
ncbi:LAP4 Aspartyl aminopeptidase [Acidimicrobiia bacterium]